MRVFGDRYRVEVRMDPAHDDVVAILAPRVVGGGKIVEAIWLVFLMRLEGDDPDWQPWGGGLAELAEQRAHLFEVENCFPPFPLTSGGQQIEISGLDLQPLLGGESRLLPDKRRQQSEPKGPLHSGHKGNGSTFLMDDSFRRSGPARACRGDGGRAGRIHRFPARAWRQVPGPAGWSPGTP